MAATALKEMKSQVNNDQRTVDQESDSTLQILNNIVPEDQNLDNEVNNNEDSANEEDTQEEEDKEKDRAEKALTNLRVEKDQVVSPEENVSVKIEDSLSSADTDDAAGAKVVPDGSIEETSDVFDTNTGVTQAQAVPDATQAQAVSDVAEEEGFGEAAEARTGAKKGLTKKKKFLFSVISGLKKAKKGIGNFFKKTLPKAFKTGAGYARKALEYTPAAPVLKLYDKIKEKWDEYRPLREMNAQLKKEKLLMDEAGARRAKAEELRLKEEKKALKAKAKAALWEEKKKNNTLDYRTVQFFKGVWNGVKKGASWIGNKIKTGATWVGAKIMSTRGGQALGRVAAKTVKEVKRIVIDTKNAVCGVIAKVTGAIEGMKDEYDAYSFEERMQKITEEENKKRENGEEVPKDDYRTRFLALTDELRGKLASIRNNVDRREEIERSLAEMEGNTVMRLPGKEEVDAEVWQNVGDKTKDADISGTVFSAAGNVKSFIKVEEYTNKDLQFFMNQDKITGIGVIKIVSALGQVGSESAKVQVFRHRKQLMDAIASTSKDELLRRVSQYAKSQAQLDEMVAGFNVAQNIISIGQGAAEMTGAVGATVSSALGTVNSVLSGVKMLATSAKTRANVKAGIKDMLGGKEGYYALKKKYRMHAPEMRRAVRDALGVATSEDAVTADKWELSHLMSERAKSGESGPEMDSMIAEAGGLTERHFDRLQGAGKTVRRRNANRQARMIA